MQKASFSSLQKKPQETKLVQGVRGGRVPEGAVAGGNGSFIVVTQYAQLLLTIKLNKNDYLTKDIYLLIKEMTDRRITDKLVRELVEFFNDKEFIVENGEIQNIKDLIAQCFA